jgi:hypothetical protein
MQEWCGEVMRRNNVRELQSGRVTKWQRIESGSEEMWKCGNEEESKEESCRVTERDEILTAKRELG